MDIQKFLFQLHFEIDKVKPESWIPDWEDAPLPYKMYKGLRNFPLSSDIPLTLDGGDFRAAPGIRGIGHFLWYVYGIAQVTRTLLPADLPPEMAGPPEGYRRTVASGGGLYPNELYVYLREGDLPAGVYHYDAARHRLGLLREGNFDRYVSMSLGKQTGITDGCAAVVFVSVMYWKNFFKYHNFSYRLQGLDTGVLMGQLLEAAKRFGYAPRVHFQFLDRAVNHLLGLRERDESVYAVIPLAARHDGEASPNIKPMIASSDLCREIPAVRHSSHVRSRKIKEYPLLLRMNEAARLETTAHFRQVEYKTEGSGETGKSIIPLPPVHRLSYDFAAVTRHRPSPETDFVLQRVRLEQLAGLLYEASSSYRYLNDWDGDARLNPKPRVTVFGSFYGVEGLGDGAYRYDSRMHGLIPIRAGDHRTWLQYGMSLHNVNLFQVPLCLHIAGSRHHEQAGWGARGYRMQQMEAGMLAQRLLLAAAALGMGGRPLLGFDADMCDQLYRLAPSGQTTLIQIPVGHYRRTGRYEGSLHG